MVNLLCVERRRKRGRGADELSRVSQGDDIEALNQVLARSEGQMIVLQVWSTKRKELRSAYSPCEGGDGS